MDFVLPGVVKIPRKNSLLEGAMLEPINTVLKAVKMLSLLRGDHVLVAPISEAQRVREAADLLKAKPKG